MEHGPPLEREHRPRDMASLRRSAAGDSPRSASTPAGERRGCASDRQGWRQGHFTPSGDEGRVGILGHEFGGLSTLEKPRCPGTKGVSVSSPLPPGEGPGVRGRCRGLSPQTGRYSPFPHPKRAWSSVGPPRRHESGSEVRCGSSWERGHLARLNNRGPSARCGQDARAPRKGPFAAQDHFHAFRMGRHRTMSVWENSA